VSYPIPEIQAETQTNVLRQVRPLSLVPLGADRALFLLSDRLMEFHSAANRTRALLRVELTRWDGLWIWDKPRTAACGSQARLA